MSANTDLVEKIQYIIANELLPALKAAEQDKANVAGEEIDIPQQTKAKLKQRVNDARVECLTTLNQIQV